MGDPQAQPARKEQLDLGAYAFVSSAAPAEGPPYPEQRFRAQLKARQEPYEVIFHLRICAHTDPEPRGVFPALIPEILKCYF